MTHDVYGGRNDFISAYFQYIGETEAPMTFHRWSCITILGAWIGRDYCFHLGHFNIKPNIYCMLMGTAGSRKSTAIKIAARLLGKTGYNTIAADRTTKEKFLLDLSGAPDFVLDSNGKLSGKSSSDSTLMEEALFGDMADSVHIPEMLIAADEFNTFVGNGNIEFLSMLGVLWDHEGTFKNKVKNSKSVELHNPYVSIIAGNTPTGFSLAFPAEAIGQGIFSRIILVHGEPTGKRITFPEGPSEADTKQILDILHAIKGITKQAAVITNGAKRLLDAIYRSSTPMSDVRFESYANRRFSHLLKICLVLSAAAMRSVIEECDVVYANTVLTHTEHGMSKALGEFGKSRHSDVNHKLISILENSYEPMPVKELWKQLHNDLDDIATMKDMLTSLVIADKVLGTKQGFLIKRKVFEEVEGKYVDFSLLTEEERRYIK
jgi:hypothetical protein